MQPDLKILRMVASMRWLRRERDQLHQSFCCRTHSTFSKSVMVSMGVSKVGRMDLLFIDVTISGAHYLQVLLTHKLLPDMRKNRDEYFIFQQGNAAAHQSQDTIDFLKRDTGVHFTRPLATQQQRAESNWLQIVGRNAAAGLPSSWCRRTEAALVRCLA